MGRLLTLTKKTGILNNIYYESWLRDVYDPLLATIQLMLTHWSLRLRFRNTTHSFYFSQHTVYAHPSVQLLFLDSNKSLVNVGFLLHVVNFFKYHITKEDEQTAFGVYCALANGEKFKAWDGPLTQGLKKLGSDWKSSYGKLFQI